MSYWLPEGLLEYFSVCSRLSALLQGSFWSLPLKTSGPQECSPGGCQFDSGRGRRKRRAASSQGGCCRYHKPKGRFWEEPPVNAVVAPGDVTTPSLFPTAKSRRSLQIQWHHGIKMTDHAAGYSWWGTKTCGLFPQPSYTDRTPNPGTAQISSAVCKGCQSPSAEALVSTTGCKAVTRGCCSNLPEISGLEAMVHLCYITEAFFYATAPPALPCYIRLLWRMKNIVIFNSWIRAQWA